MVLQVTHLLASRRIPQMNLPIITTTGQQLAIRAEGQVVDQVLMSPERQRRLTDWEDSGRAAVETDFPQTAGRAAGHGQQLTIATEGQGSHPASLSGEFARQF